MQLVLQVADGGVLQEVLLSGGRLVAFVALVGFRDFPLVAVDVVVEHLDGDHQHHVRDEQDDEPGH
eukprot:10110810-Alexandrium_andersonii.AAC.1